MNTAPNSESTPSQEGNGNAKPGGLMLMVLLVMVIAAVLTAMYFIDERNEAMIALTLVGGILGLITFLVGFFVVQPNTAHVLVFFGKYRGTIRDAGFYWTNPFTRKTSISLRANNLASETIKVNDLNGNPIEIAAVVVWRVKDTAKASFDVEDYTDYVGVQIETAVRELAKTHPYEAHENGEDEVVHSLRSGSEMIAAELTVQLQSRLDRAGIEVLEARISHLAYALEIASAMLQRQQAAAIISARRLIVEGAVGMVEHALEDLGKRGVVELDDERKATMVTNLLVVLCSHSEPTPVINTGGVYN